MAAEQILAMHPGRDQEAAADEKHGERDAQSRYRWPDRSRHPGRLRESAAPLHPPR